MVARILSDEDHASRAKPVLRMPFLLFAFSLGLQFVYAVASGTVVRFATERLEEASGVLSACTRQTWIQSQPDPRFQNFCQELEGNENKAPTAILRERERVLEGNCKQAPHTSERASEPESSQHLWLFRISVRRIPKPNRGSPFAFARSLSLSPPCPASHRIGKKCRLDWGRGF